MWATNLVLFYLPVLNSWTWDFFFFFAVQPWKKQQFLKQHFSIIKHCLLDALTFGVGSSACLFSMHLAVTIQPVLFFCTASSDGKHLVSQECSKWLFNMAKPQELCLENINLLLSIIFIVFENPNYYRGMINNPVVWNHTLVTQGAATTWDGAFGVEGVWDALMYSRT